MIVSCFCSTGSLSVWGAALFWNPGRLADWIVSQCPVFPYFKEKLEKDSNFQINNSDRLLMWHLSEDWSEVFSIDIFLWGILRCETIRDKSPAPSTEDRVVTVRFHAAIVGVRSIRHPPPSSRLYHLLFPACRSVTSMFEYITHLTGEST